ncbi:MAG TPA: hypothetical protein ENI89_00680 [Desulfobulbus sp.]|nr:hypothetical protein [Desulfobulbus sp.]
MAEERKTATRHHSPAGQGMPPREKAADRQGMFSHDLTTCEVCGGRVSRLADACPHCGDPGVRGNVADSMAGCVAGIGRGIVALIFLYALLSVGVSALLKSCGLY